MSELVLIERVAATIFLTLNRPHARNALTRPLLRELTEALQQASTDPRVRCVVLTGAGGHFCAGADLRQNVAEDPELLDHVEEYMDEFHALIRSVVRCERPTIAALDGAAVGFGADLAFACDLRIGARPAFVQERFVRIGLMPDGGGTFWLPRLLGTARALQAILLAEKIEAPELERLGLLVRAVESDQLREATLEVARHIEAGPPLAHAAIKRAVYASLGSLEDALRREREEQVKLLRTADFMEGVSAWMERRTPTFQGR